MALIMKNIIQISIVTILLSLTGLSTFAQDCVVKGVVVDKSTSEPLPYTNVYIKETQQGSLTDDHGYYIISKIKPGDYTLVVFSIGYDSVSESIHLTEGSVLTENFNISGKAYNLQEVSVSGERADNISKVKVSEIKIIPTDIEMTPSIASMPDISQHLLTLPGIISTGDVGGRLYIRGGAPIQNKTTLDGAIIYSPMHSIGLFSVIDIDAVRNMKVFTGGFGAEYGGAISSVMDITTRNGNVSKYSGKVDISTIASKVLIEGPIIKKKSADKPYMSFMLSAKGSYLEQAKDIFYGYIDRELPYTFTDFYGKLSFFASDAFKIDLFGFLFNDRVQYTNSPLSYSWKSSGFGGRMTAMPKNSTSIVEISFAGSNYSMNFDETNFSPRTSEISSGNFGLHITNYIGESYFKYGAEVITLKTDYLFYSTDYNDTEQQQNSSEMAGYVTFHGKFGKLIIEPGFRLNWYTTLSKIFPSPVLAAKLNVTEKFRLKLAAGIYSQNLLSATSDMDILNFFKGYLSAPVNLVDKFNGKPVEDQLQKSQHIIFGTEVDIGEYVFLNLEGYLKNYPQLIGYNNKKIVDEEYGENLPEVLTKDFVVETGKSYGVELSGKYEDAIKIFKFTYTYAIAKRAYEDAFGEMVEYYPHYDRRHNFNVMATVFAGDKNQWQFNARWNFGTGFPFFKTTGYYEFIRLDENEVNNYLTQNGDMRILLGDETDQGRLPNYHRLDISVKRSFKFKKSRTLEAEFNIVNVYNQKNIFYQDRITNETIYQLPFLPGLRIGYYF
jgi:hypothetical protein